MDSVSSTQNPAVREVRTLGDTIGRRLKTAWSVSDVRLPLVALAVTLIGAFLPWVAGTSATQLVGWHLPVLAVVIVTAALVVYVTAPGRPGWLGIVAAGISFVIAASAAVMLVLLLALAHVITSVEDAIAHLGVGIGAWVTTAAAAAVFIGTLRLLLTTT
jgi:hypothetical protein